MHVKLPNGEEFNLNPLSYDINPQECKYQVKSMKIELELSKSIKNIHWNSLTKLDDNDSGNTAQTNKAYPSNRGKDWNKINIEEDENEADKSNPDHFFKALFKDADDDTRKAMMKSYSESGGTTLSTNWSEVQKKKVESAPPTGLEAKSWNE